MAPLLVCRLQADVSQPVLEFSAFSYATGETEGSVLLTVVRTGDVEPAVTVDYATVDGTAIAGVKYTATSGTLAFPAGAPRQTISVPLLNDSLRGGFTKFNVRLSNPSGGAVLGLRAEAAVTILDADSGISFRLAAYSFAEGAGAAVLGINRGGDGNEPIQVELATVDGTAVDGRDYTGVQRTLELPGDRQLSFISIPILNNQLVDGTRNFRVTLSNPVGGSLGCTKAVTISILDNDGFQFESSSYSVVEDCGAVRVAVQRGEADSTAPVTVQFTTSDATALSDSDYAASSGVLTFAPGERVKKIAVPIVNDSVKDGVQTFNLTLSNPAGADLGTRVATTITIRDNDPGAGFERASHAIWSGAGEVILVVQRGGEAAPEAFTVDFETRDGTAKEGEDYVPVSGVLEFNKNENVKEITIPVLRKDKPGPSRTFEVALSSSTAGLALAAPLASVRIEDNYCTVTPPIDSELALHATTDGHVITWSWSGQLQAASQVTGPWETLPGARSPHRINLGPAATFYRVTSPRPAKVYVPPSYDGSTPVPLVLLLHGLGDSGQGVEDYMHFRPLAESRGFLYCYPDGSMIQQYRGWSANDFSGDPARDLGVFPDDAGYLRSLIEEITRRFVVDRKRIYVVGRSNGGSMAYRMACQFSDVVAAIASHAGVSFFDTPACIPSEPVNVLRLQSVADNYWGASLSLCDGFILNTLQAPSVMQTVRQWAKYNQCGEPETDPEPSLDLVLDVAGPDTIITRYPDHLPGGAVELWTMTGGPHRPAFSPKYSAAIVDWLLAHPKP